MDAGLEAQSAKRETKGAERETLISSVDAASESAENAGAFVKATAHDAVVGVRDFTQRVSPELKAQADAVEAEILARTVGAKEKIARVVGVSQQGDLGVAEQSPAVIAARILQRKPKRVQMMPTISIGDVPPKVARRMTPEDLTAVVTRKQISIGGEKGVSVTAESVEGRALSEVSGAVEESPAVIAARLLQRRPIGERKLLAEQRDELEQAEADLTKMHTEAEARTPVSVTKTTEVKKIAAEAEAAEATEEQRERLERIEASFSVLNTESERLFAAGDREGLLRLAEEMERTIDEKGREVVELKKQHPDLELAPKDHLYAFLIGRTLLDIQMARRDRVEAQIALLQKKQEHAPAEEIASLESQISKLDGEIRGKIGDLMDLKREEQSAKSGAQNVSHGSLDSDGGYDGGGYYGRGTGDAAPGNKAPAVAAPIREALISTTEKTANILSGTLTRWMDFAVTGKTSIVDELNRWGNELGSSAKDKELKSKRAQKDQKAAQ